MQKRVGQLELQEVIQKKKKAEGKNPLVISEQSHHRLFDI